MSAALYQPVYLLSILVIGFWMSFNRIYSPDCHLQEEGSHALFPFLFCLALAFWIGFRPVSYIFGDTVNYAMEYNLKDVQNVLLKLQINEVIIRMKIQKKQTVKNSGQK